MPGVGLRTVCHLFRCAADNDSAASVSTLRTKVDDPVCHFNNIEIVFDDYYGVAGVGQTLQNLYETVDVCGVQTCGRFVQDIDGFPGRTLGKLCRQLATLCLAAGKSRGWLAAFQLSPPPRRGGPGAPVSASKPVSRVLSFKTAIYLDAPSPVRSSRLPGTVGPTICPSTALLRIEFTATDAWHAVG